MTPTNALTKAIIEYLTYKHHYVYRNNNAPIYDRKKGTFRSNNTEKGIADIIGVTGGAKDQGIFIAVEVKGTKTDRQSPEQKIFEEEVKKRAGIYILARSLDDVEKVL